ncbi:MAG: addiction module toxin, HicA family [Acidobacteria bacterium]|nr:MAG: addiction module toxin, HicA family [Acidobacteriota bacterium]
MKRTDLVRHLESCGCRLLREGGRHSIYCNQDRTKFSAVPRHKEVKTFVARNICRDLGVPVVDK